MDPNKYREQVTLIRGQTDSRFPPPQRGDYNPAHVYQDRIDLRPPQTSELKTATPRTQLEADELYARQLAEHYNNAGRQRGILLLV